MTDQRFRWGILGLGKIARKFAIGLQSVASAELYAVGSRTMDKADAFGAEFGATARYGSYEELAADPNVDAIYVATPHTMHKADTLACLAAGKPVLCEKPFAINAVEARAMVDESRKRGVFLMEGMWTRFFPAMAALRRLVAEGRIGDVRMVQADFGFRAPFDPESRLFKPSLGGGSLLDVGIYPVSLASMLLGAPIEIKSMANLGATGVDEEAAILMRYSNGRLAVLTSASRLLTQHEVVILGAEGMIRIADPWWIPQRLTVIADGNVDVFDMGMVGNGYNYEAEEVERCVRAGAIESKVIPHDESLQIMETLDQLRAQWGIVYPTERPGAPR